MTWFRTFQPPPRILVPMACNLDRDGRQLRLGFGATGFLTGLLLIVLVYLNIIGFWGWIVGGASLLAGAGGILAACYGYCMLKPVIGR
jgi:hypothetical protein